MAGKLANQKAADAFDTGVDFLESFEGLEDPWGVEQGRGGDTQGTAAGGRGLTPTGRVKETATGRRHRGRHSTALRSLRRYDRKTRLRFDQAIRQGRQNTGELMPNLDLSKIGNAVTLYTLFGSDRTLGNRDTPAPCLLSDELHRCGLVHAIAVKAR